MNKRIPLWARAFFEENHSGKTSRTILKNFKNLSIPRQERLKVSALRALRENALRRNKSLRDGAVGLIVALLPKTFQQFKSMLTDTRSPRWHEIHFAVFCALDSNDLSIADQEHALHIIENYLMNLKSQAGFAGWMAGDLLGAHWHSSEAIDTLKRVALLAKYVAGRKAAMHGLAHAISTAATLERKRLRTLVHKVSELDRSPAVKREAKFVLKGIGCAKVHKKHILKKS